MWMRCSVESEVWWRGDVIHEIFLALTLPTTDWVMAMSCHEVESTWISHTLTGCMSRSHTYEVRAIVWQEYVCMYTLARRRRRRRRLRRQRRWRQRQWCTPSSVMDDSTLRASPSRSVRRVNSFVEWNWHFWFLSATYCANVGYYTLNGNIISTTVANVIAFYSFINNSNIVWTSMCTWDAMMF